MVAFKKRFCTEVAVYRWHNKRNRNWVLEDIVYDGNDILSPKEIDKNLKYIRENLIPTLFTEEEFKNIVIPYCEKAKLEYRGENKYPAGTKVFINKCPESMSHFPQLCEAIVEYTYAEKYKGRDYKNYSLNIDGVSHSWYPEEVLSKIHKVGVTKCINIGCDVITSENSIGTNNLIKEGAYLFSKIEDVLNYKY